MKLVVLIVTLLAVLTLGCTPPPDFVTKAQVDALIAAGNKAFQNTIDSLQRNVDAANAKVGQTYTKDEINNIFLKRSEYSGSTSTSYSKTESDNMYATKGAIADLQSKITSLTEKVNKLETVGPGTSPSQGGGYTGGTSNGVEVAFTPAPPPFWGGTTSQTLNFSVTVTNKSSTFKYVRLQALFTSYNGQAVNIEVATLTFNAPYVPGDIPCPLTFYQSQAVCTQMNGTWSGQAQPVGPNQSAYIYGHLTLKHATGGTQWNMNLTPIATDYQ